MIIGHYAVSFLSSRIAPRMPLWQPMIGVVWLDILHSSLVIAGVERAEHDPSATAVVPIALLDYPYSHSLLASVLWSLAAYLLYVLWVARREPQKHLLGAIAALAVFSHFVLDLVTHRPDLPLIDGEPKLGFGLWNHMAATYIVENAVLFGAYFLYVRAKPSIRPRETWGLLALCVLGSAMFFTFPIAAFPEDIRYTEAFALLTYVLVPLAAYWAGKPAPKRAAA
jgi:membrane-bound metal-dependent hydrolase YbcI (DUF457 family)